MNGIQFVERPKVEGKRGSMKYGDYYAALRTTLTSGQAIKVALSRRQSNSIRLHFQNMHPGMKVRSRTLPDGLYLWIEQVQVPQPQLAAVAR